MSTRTEKMLGEIRRRFALIAADIEIDNKSSLYDRNSHMERYFKQILNAIYETNLVSTNLDISNYPAIDLKDAAGKIAYQITATNTKQKINNTIDTFFKHKLENEIDTLNFLILKNFQGPKISVGSKGTVNYEVITIFDLSRIIADLDDESKIAEIHEIVMVEYIVEATSSVGIKAGATFKLSGIGKLIQQVGFDATKDIDDIATFNDEFEAFVKELSGLSNSQRTILYELIYRCKTLVGDHTTVYITTNVVMAQFTDSDRILIDSLIDLDLIRLDREFTILSFEPEITVLLLRHGSAFDLNIFAELKRFANNEQDVLQKMFISLDFDCLK